MFVFEMNIVMMSEMRRETRGNSMERQELLQLKSGRNKHKPDEDVDGDADDDAHYNEFPGVGERNAFNYYNIMRRARTEC